MQSSRTQFFRFVVVGFVSNLLLFVFYLLLTSAGLGHKVAMTALFAVGTLQTFAFNKRWTFGHGGAAWVTLLRYVVSYGAAYVTNLVALVLLVDVLGYAHQLVQGAMILILAVSLFLAQKYWVFRRPALAATSGSCS